MLLLLQCMNNILHTFVGLLLHYVNKSECIAIRTQNIYNLVANSWRLFRCQTSI